MWAELKIGKFCFFFFIKTRLSPCAVALCEFCPVAFCSNTRLELFRVFVCPLRASVLACVFANFPPCLFQSIVPVLQTYETRRPSELRVVRQDCGGNRTANTKSLMLSFESCTPPLQDQHTPIFDPLQTLATFVHSTLATFPVDAESANAADVPPAQMISTHLYEAFRSDKKAGKKEYDRLRGTGYNPEFSMQHRSTLPDDHAVVDRIIRMAHNRTSSSIES